MSDDTIDVIIPARNTHKTIGEVVKPFAKHPAIGRIIVSINPPDLRISKALWDAESAGIIILYTDAEGKGQAVSRALQYVHTEHVVLCDSDLTGLTEDHVSMLISDAVMGEESLLIGVPDLPSNYPECRDWAWPWVSGQRCIPVRLLRPLRLHGYLMETQINRAARHAGYPVRWEWLTGLHSPYNMTEQRLAARDRDAEWGRKHGIL